MLEYWKLIRPKIVLMVLAAMLVSGWTAAESAEPQSRAVSARIWINLFNAMLGTTGVIVGAIALNQRLECQGDAKMPRTAERPLPAGRLSAREVTWFAAIASLLGTAYLICFSNLTLVILAIAGWAVYVLAYTPLKRRSIWQTPVGAAAGAMPALLGAAAIGAPLSPIGWSLFGVVFCWQLPHAMAIAWLYRRQFADAGVRVATVVDTSGRIAGRFAVFGAILLLPISLAPAIYSEMGWIYGIFAALLGLGYFFFSFAFYRSMDDAAALRLLWASLVYLPLILILLVAARTI
ncbi:MAG: heme o synthase [Thermoguttaceae bacterium]|jgi:protoheme IX farnesyltransferase